MWYWSILGEQNRTLAQHSKDVGSRTFKAEIIHGLLLNYLHIEEKEELSRENK